MESIDGASDLKKSKQNLKKGKAKAKEVGGTVRDAVHLRKEVLRKDLRQPTEHTTPAAPTDNPHGRESSKDDEGVGQGAGEREWSMVGKGKASNEANEAVQHEEEDTCKRQFRF
ncbi:hypothetical protein SCLCIDRAFT_30326 [Scleroderma citrinum Foug A]|uniref:Uncharacterized protein n=1 Tax=Scleroderma citrinum Foug A TaxID=1036808 RepID=A0A0C2ZSA6_9AGAM|nr:hypothetical protein SCLCIDRAFT_30326 [Scleroderma citrinum Foug A]